MSFLSVRPKPGGTETAWRHYARLYLPVAVLGVGALLSAEVAGADLPAFLQHVVGASSMEAALFRLMALPGVQALYPRPPKEATEQVSGLLARAPGDAELLALRARTEEASLDFAAAEADWKSYAGKAPDHTQAELELADFFHRRMNVAGESTALNEVAQAPPLASERFLNPAEQRSWTAFERLLALEADQGLGPGAIDATYRGFLGRYAAQPAVFSRFFRVLLDQKDYTAAEALLPRYRQAFPADKVFPITAEALLEYRRGDAARALAVLDRAFDPLWPSTLVASFYTLQTQTHQGRIFLQAAQDRLAQHPDDLNALARVFFFHQQAGHTPAALRALDGFRRSKDERSAAWSPLGLYTVARLSAQLQAWPEVARYDYALAASAGSLPDGEAAAQAGSAGLIHVLLSAPDQPLAVAAGNLTLLRDIGTLDQGPGFLNGILSLWLNGTSPEREYNEETAKAQPLFHRAKAAELLARFDHDFPAAAERASLHAEMIRASALYGEPAMMEAQGKEFLAGFPGSADRVEIAGLLADAYAREKNQAAEFAVYDSLLAELAAKTAGQPLSAAGAGWVTTSQTGSGRAGPLDADAVPGAIQVPDDPNSESTSAFEKVPVFDLPAAELIAATIPEAAQYRQVLDRYVGRLVATNQLPRALAVLRRELDRSPDDPLLYERLASFLQGNDLSAQQEQVYRLALSHFADKSWYDKLGRLYLRGRRRQDFSALTRQVTDIFTGTELESWFRQINPGDAGIGLALQLNLYAAKRFPHDLVFTRDLLTAYTSKGTADQGKWEALIRAHWWEAADLRDHFFEYLSRTGKLEAELAQLQPSGGAGVSGPGPAAGTNDAAAAGANPAAMREAGEISLWTSHFEQAAPLFGTLADLYPADAEVGDRAVSLFRSLAYLDLTPASTARAAGIEEHLLSAAPDSPERLGTLGDLYAEARSTGGEDLRSAGPFWRRIPSLHPGAPGGFLTSATIFWDYFQFEDARAELIAARTRFGKPALFGYEAGAIEESRYDLPAAVREYTAAALDQHPAESGRSTADSEADENEARARLLQLARRPATAALVDQTTAAAGSSGLNTGALSLRAEVLSAQHREPELAPALESALTRASTAEEAAAVGDLARAHRLTPVFEHALLREIALSADPIERIELEYALARSYEDRKDLPDANRVIESVYRSNPRLLGVVRSTVDFSSRTKQPQRGVATLLDAARAATPELADSFTYEAAGKSNAAGDTAQARRLAESLLRKSPFDARYLAVAADSYARNNDNGGLKQFLLGKLEEARTASMTAEARKENIALLRRGLIPALTRLNDFEGAMDQYIALLSAYPEDAATAGEASLYALEHSRGAQLLGFLRAAVQASPRDSRFAILLAQTENTFGDLAAALAAYSQAISIRKDRVDLYTARADLEIRLDQPEAAAADYGRLYVLSYKDPAWMLQLAELRARQGRRGEAAKALETAYVAGRTPSPANFFTVAADLERWNLLDEARRYAEQGVALAGNDLLVPSSVPQASAAAANRTASTASPDSDASEDATPDGAGVASPAGSFLVPSSNVSGAALYVRILTRMGEPDRALGTLLAARRAAETASPSLLAVLTRGFAAKDEAKMRKGLGQRRQQAIETAFSQVLTSAGTTVRSFGTPESKAHFAQLLTDSRRAEARVHPRPWIAAAHAAGLAELEAGWLSEALLAPGKTSGFLAPYTTLQRSRLQFHELAQTLETYAGKLPANERDGTLREAAGAFGLAGDEADELRLERRLVDDADRDRFFDLLLRHDAGALFALASSANANLADAAAEYVVAHGTQTQAFAAVNARAKAPDVLKTPLWGPATTALVGLYFASSEALPGGGQGSANIVDASFRQILSADRSVGEHLPPAGAADHPLTGSLWFFYGNSYGIYRLASPGSGDAEDFVAAGLEHNPGLANSYVQLARSYAEAGKLDAALGEYSHALELSPGSAAVLDEEAELLFGADRRDAAMVAWRGALGALASDAEKNAFPASFWTSFASVTEHLGEHGLTSQLHAPLEAILRPYFNHNGNYRSTELLRQAFSACGSQAEGTELILSSTAAAPQQDVILADLRGVDLRAGGVSGSPLHHTFATSTGDVVDLPHEQFLFRRIELARAHSRSSARTGGEDPPSPDEVMGLQLDLNRLYLDRNELTKSEALLDSLPDSKSNASPEIDRIELAARMGRLAPLLATWTSQPEKVPPQYQLDSAILHLQQPTPDYKPNPAQIRPLLEFDFEHKRLRADLQATDYLALAQARLETVDLPGALDLLRRLTFQPPSTNRSATNLRTYPSSSADVSADDLVSPELSQDPFGNFDSAARVLESSGHTAEAIPFLEALSRDVPWNASFRLRLAEAQIVSAGVREEGFRNLVAVARDSSAPYQVRLQAARNLAGPREPHLAVPELGSGELNLIAQGRLGGSGGAQAARQPFFAAARALAAAAMASAPASNGKPAGESLLREAIAIDPAGPLDAEARFRLLRLDLPASDPGPALDLLEGLSSTPVRPSAEEVQSEGSEGDDTAPAEAADTLPAGAATLDLPARVRLAEEIADAYGRAGSPARGLHYLQVADSLRPGNVALQQRIRHLQASIRLDVQNALRRPTIHRALDQAPEQNIESEPRTVRPRLLAASNPVPRTAETPQQEVP